MNQASSSVLQHHDKVLKDMSTFQKQFENHAANIDQEWKTRIQEMEKKVSSKLNELEALRQKLSTQCRLETSICPVDHVVKLNVGGTIFCTTVGTLSRYEDSIFPAMLRWEHFHKKPTYMSQTMTTTKTTASDTQVHSLDNVEEKELSEGSLSQEPIFIDRSPRMFDHILEFLRTGRVFGDSLSTEQRNDLCADAEFYGLEKLVNLIKTMYVNKPIPSVMVDYRNRSFRAKDVATIEIGQPDRYSDNFNLIIKMKGGQSMSFDYKCRYDAIEGKKKINKMIDDALSG